MNLLNRTKTYQNKISTAFLAIFLLFCSSFTLANVSLTKGYEHVTTVYHLHSTYSDGDFTMEEVIKKAKNVGYEGVIFADHSHMSGKYSVGGLFPITYSDNALNISGFTKYVKELKKLNEKYPEMTFLPAFESAPFYYWSGNISNGLTMEMSMKHFVVLGIDTQKKFESIPQIMQENSSFEPGFKDKGIAPYKEFVDGVHKNNGLVFVAHPSFNHDTKSNDKLRLHTPAYADIITKVEADGTAIQGFDLEIIKPGGFLDQAFLNFKNGKRKVFPKISIDNDYHRGNFAENKTMVIFIPDKNAEPEIKQQEMLNSIADGRYYIVFGKRPYMALQDFTLHLNSEKKVEVTYKINSKNNLKRVLIVRDGALMQTATEKNGNFVDTALDTKKNSAVYYRIMAEDKTGKYLMTNYLKLEINTQLENTEKPQEKSWWQRFAIFLRRILPFI